MKTHKLLLLILGIFAAASTTHAQIVTLDVLDSDILVGETFGVDVLVFDDPLDLTTLDELTSFAFDVSESSTTLSFLGATVDPAFTDDSALFPSIDVAGSAFPGVTVPPVPSVPIKLATLTFSAVAPGVGGVSAIGPIGLDTGLKYITFGDLSDPFDDTFADYPIDAFAEFEISVIPEPSTVAFFGLGALGVLLAFRRRSKAA